MEQVKEIIEIIFQERYILPFLLIVLGGGFLLLLNTKGLYKGKSKDDDNFKIDLFD